MPPTASFEVSADCQAVVNLASHALKNMPCARCMLLGLSALLIVTFFIWFMLPTRICRKMDACFHMTERLYHGSIIAGLVSLSCDPEAAQLFHRLQRRVSQIQERQLHNSLRPWCEVLDIFNGQSLAILRCIWDIKVLKNRIEVLREIRLQEILEDSFRQGVDGHGFTPSPSEMRHTRLSMCDC
ncbi:hypothetical protein FB451DRAFT_1258787 [Mycena latifolia]|nr:hypothetical protein FB451DRAFT_1258787 [Mycena latifolia]